MRYRCGTLIVSIKIKPQFCQGIESAPPPPDCIPWMYNILDGPYSLGIWVRGGPYSLRVYGPPGRTLPRTVYPMTPGENCTARYNVHNQHFTAGGTILVAKIVPVSQDILAPHRTFYPADNFTMKKVLLLYTILYNSVYIDFIAYTCV